MIEAEETLALLSALEEGAPAAKFEQLMRGPELGRVFPSVGIPDALGFECLLAVHDSIRREHLDEEGKMVVSYLEGLVQARSRFEALLRSFQETEASLTSAAFASVDQIAAADTALKKHDVV